MAVLFPYIATLVAGFLWLIFLTSFLLRMPLRQCDFKLAAFYMSGFFYAAPAFEWLFNNIYGALFGSNLWTYHLLPLSNGDTSWLAIIIWPSVGLNAYILRCKLAHANLPEKKHTLAKGVLLGGEGLFYEAFFNILFLSFFGVFLVYYHPKDLWHLTSIQVLPIYIFCGLLVGFLIERFKEQIKWSYCIGLGAVGIINLFVYHHFF